MPELPNSARICESQVRIAAPAAGEDSPHGTAAESVEVGFVHMAIEFMGGQCAAATTADLGSSVEIDLPIPGAAPVQPARAPAHEVASIHHAPAPPASPPPSAPATESPPPSPAPPVQEPVPAAPVPPAVESAPAAPPSVETAPQSASGWQPAQAAPTVPSLPAPTPLAVEPVLPPPVLESVPPITPLDDALTMVSMEADAWAPAAPPPEAKPKLVHTPPPPPQEEPKAPLAKDVSKGETPADESVAGNIKIIRTPTYKLDD